MGEFEIRRALEVAAKHIRHDSECYAVRGRTYCSCGADEARGVVTRALAQAETAQPPCHSCGGIMVSALVCAMPKAGCVALDLGARAETAKVDVDAEALFDSMQKPDTQAANQVAFSTAGCTEPRCTAALQPLVGAVAALRAAWDKSEIGQVDGALIEGVERALAADEKGGGR